VGIIAAAVAALFSIGKPKWLLLVHRHFSYTETLYAKFFASAEENKSAPKSNMKIRKNK
jgi:hypothetical protein